MAHSGAQWPRSVLAVTALVMAAAACSPAARRAAIAPPSTTSPTIAPTTTTTVPPFAGYLVADIHADVPGYLRPGGRPVTTVPATWYGVASNLAVIARSGQWLDVRLATRPNQSTIWVQQGPDVTLARTFYRIVVHVAAHRLQLYDDQKLILDVPAGVGTPTDPTPTGHYFLAFDAAPPTPLYGPFVIVTSAHSDAITDWEGMGDALIAIHGPIGDDAAIGTTGSAISHGCIRLHNSDLAQLRSVPPGSPIDIVA